MRIAPLHRICYLPKIFSRFSFPVGFQCHKYRNNIRSSVISDYFTKQPTKSGLKIHKWLDKKTTKSSQENILPSLAERKPREKNKMKESFLINQVLSFHS